MGLLQPLIVHESSYDEEFLDRLFGQDAEFGSHPALTDGRQSARFIA